MGQTAPHRRGVGRRHIHIRCDGFTGRQHAIHHVVYILPDRRPGIQPVMQQFVEDDIRDELVPVAIARGRIHVDFADHRGIDLAVEGRSRAADRLPRRLLRDDAAVLVREHVANQIVVRDLRRVHFVKIIDRRVFRAGDALLEIFHQNHRGGIKAAIAEILAIEAVFGDQNDPQHFVHHAMSPACV